MTLFQAHLYTCLDCYDDKPTGRGHHWLGGSRPMLDYSVYPFNIANTTSIHEIVIPASSYRMGVPRMGYGAAIIGKLHYCSFNANDACSTLIHCTALLYTI